ncbi:zinc finger mym-type protein 1-like protein, partial [Lasius niger]
MERFLLKRPLQESSCPGETSSMDNEVKMTAKKIAIDKINDFIYTRPNQPEVLPTILPSQILKGKTLKFRTAWFKDFAWLHINNSSNGVLCFYCHKYKTENVTMSLASKMDPCFSSEGFKNWKKAIEKFKAHQKCDAHLQAVLAFNQKKIPLEVQLNDAVAKNQAEARTCLTKIITSLRFLARQGLAIRGHEHYEGNFYNLLKLRTTDFPPLEKWLEKEKEKMTHPSVQNELLELMAHEILRKICTNINSQKTPIFAIICDATRDISGFEQESICIRYVDEHLDPIENFIGLYTASDMTAEGIAAILKDVMIRLQLPITNLRGQTYDGAPTMSGCKGGVQALIKEKQPLALFVHCGAHCVNLVTKDVCEVSNTVRNSMQWAPELGVLFNRSAKAKTQFTKIKEAENEGPVTNMAKIKPLCPTRWIYRLSQIVDILKNYSSVLDTLEEMSKDNSTNSASASGLLKLFQSGTTVLGLLMAKDIIAQLEIFNKSLQSRQLSVSSMIEAISDLSTAFMDMRRSDESFRAIFNKASTFADDNNLE